MSKACACRVCCANVAAGRELFDPSTVVWETCVRTTFAGWRYQPPVCANQWPNDFATRAEYRAAFGVNRPMVLLPNVT
jgi:hypothetical protein